MQKTDFDPGRSPIIRNLVPGLAEIGKIKIGRKGALVRNTFRMPEKLDHFLITTMMRGNDENYILDTELMQMLMDKQGTDKLTEIPIRLLFDDYKVSFQSRYVCFRGRTRWCTGDGLAAFRKAEPGKPDIMIECPCERAEPTFPGEGKNSDGKPDGKGKCKVSGCLSCIIDGAKRFGGIWKFRSTSFNSVKGMQSTLMLFERAAGGFLGGIPLILTVHPKSAQNPIDGGQVTIYVVGIEYRGTSEEMQEAGYQIALKSEKYRQQIMHIEKQALKMISVEESAVGDDDEDTADEFHPEDAAGDAPIASGAPELVDPTPTKDPAPAVTPAAAPADSAQGKRGVRKPAQAPAQQPVPQDAQPPATPTEPAVQEPAAPQLSIPPGIDMNFF
jgi:hypothetical protein